MTAQTQTDWFLSVALPVPLRKLFDYRLPDEPDDRQQPRLTGCRVEVMFANQRLIGIVTACHQSPSIDPAKIKPVQAIIDAEGVVPAELLKLCWWASSYYQHPIGETLAAAIPGKIRQGKPLDNTRNAWQLTGEGKGLPFNGLKRAPKQQAIIQWLLEKTLLTEDELSSREFSKSSLASLIKKGLIETTRVTPAAQSVRADTELLREAPLQLGDEQAIALDQLSYHRFTCYLLEGATGSGKTEVYLQAISRVLQAGRQALVLIPEIGLTPQTIGRFRKRFHVPIAELHSGIADGARTENWLAAKEGRARIVIGTRLASMTPMQNLGIIIVDEEHDLSYKQQDGLRYSARDLSIYRASYLQIPVLLGSATPSLESLHNAIQGKYNHLRLTRRAGQARAPKVELIDMRNRELTAGLTASAINAIETTLKNRLQVMVFINRRGYAPVLMCHACGWAAECPACDAKMTLHHKPYHLHCHHCDTQKPVYRQCPQCNNTDLAPRGQGTEQTEQWLQNHCSTTPVIRIDRDSTRSKNGLTELLSTAASGEPCILIGTQMLAKGHHFPKIALVVIADADQGLMSADFRGPERMAQLIIQVAGRAGRGDVKGKVLIQSHNPEHPWLELLLSKGYHLFARQLLNERQAAFLPPFSYQCFVRAESKRPQNAIEFLNLCRNIFSGISAPGKQLQYLGPVPARMERVNDRYRYQLHITAGKRQQLLYLIAEGLKQIDQQALSKRVRWSIDVDALES